MPDLKVTVQVELDGNPIDGFPIVRRLDLAEAQIFDYQKAADGDAITFTTLPASLIPELDVLLARTDRAITLRFNAQSDAGILLNPSGFILIFDGKINSGATTNAKVNNNSGGVATIKGIGAGT